MSERRERAVMKDVPNVSAPPLLPAADDFKLPTARGILSREEIQALLRPDLPKINSNADDGPDFQRDFDKQNDGVDEREGQKIAARFSRAFGQHASLKAAVSLSSVSGFKSKSALSRDTKHEAGGAFAVFCDEEGDVTHVVCLSAALNDQLIANACGALSFDHVDTSARALSVIDCALIEQFMAPFAGLLGKGLSLVGIEMDPAYVMSLLSSGSGTRYEMDVRVGASKSRAALWSLTDDRMPEVAQLALPRPASRTGTALLTARIATLSVPVSRVASLKAGDTLLLGLPADQPVQLLSGGRDGAVAFEGDIGRKGDRIAVRVKRCA
jgi:flagellar motor switch protein FliM